MFPYILAILLGILAGTITGLIPGLHINLIATLIITNSTTLLALTSPLTLTTFLISMAVTHTITDMIPAIFLSAPESDTSLATLPGHFYLLHGRGYEAVKLTIIGSFLALLIIPLIAIPYTAFLPKLYPLLQTYMPHILIATSTFLILKEKKKFLTLIIFLASGLLGLTTFQLPISQPIFPLLTGLFGTSLLTVSLIQKTKIPKQKIISEKIQKKETAKALAASTLASSLVSFLPGLGAAQGAVIASQLTGKLSKKSFLILLGSINTLTIILGFAALYAISKPRHGIAVAIQTLLPNLTLSHLAIFLTITLIAGSIAIPTTLAITKLTAKNITKFSYKTLNISIILILTALTIALSSPLALITLATGTSIGILTHQLKIRKMHLMGSLLLPTILHYLI